MDKELKLEKEVKKLYVGYEDKNPTNKELFKLAKRTIKKGETIFKYVKGFDIEPINVETFSWETFDVKDYYKTINSHIEYLNKKFNGYFHFKVDSVDGRVIGYYDSYCELALTYKIRCNKIEEEN